MSAVRVAVGSKTGQNITVVRPYHGQQSQRFWRYRETIEQEVNGLYHGLIIFDAVEQVVDLYRVFYKLMGKDRCHVVCSNILDLTPHSMSSDKHDEKTYRVEFQFAHQVKPSGTERVVVDTHAE